MADSREISGATVSHYRVGNRLGSGGMGVVYQAEDTRLGRTVAIKFMPDDWTGDPVAISRFQREARAASALNHPNICTLHDVGEVDGRPFLVMEYLEGNTLQALLEAGPLEVDRALDLAIQAAEALDTAHSAGIVHRDIKPGNLFMTSRGQLKIMDFGLAKLTSGAAPVSSGPDAATVVIHDVTSPGAAIGTIAYMSPEQARGEPLDARTDLFSFGVVLFEMISGSSPFRAPTTALVFDAILNRDAPALTNVRPVAPAALDLIVHKALEKNRDLRYQSAAEMRADLKRLKRDRESGRFAPTEDVIKGTGAKATVPEPKPKRRVGWIAAAALAVVAAAGGGWYAFSDSPLDTLAVLPFTNVAGDPNTEYLSDGISESITSSLSQIPKLKVRSFSSVLRFKGKNVDPQEAARSLKVRGIVTGRLVRRGSDISISTELIDTRSELQVWGDQYTRPVADLVAVQEQISREISEKLRVRLTGADKQRMARHATENAQAYQLYLQGRFQWYKQTLEGLQESIDFFQQALSLDPRYALAYAGLADSYALLASSSVLPAREVGARMKEAAAKALDLDNSLAEAHTSYAWAKVLSGWDWMGAEPEFKRAIELNSSYPAAHYWYGEYLMALGRFDEAQVEMERARELNPVSPLLNTALGYRAYYAGNNTAAIEQLQKTLSADANFIAAHVFLGHAYEQAHMNSEAVAEMRKAFELSEGNSNEMAALARSLALAHQEAEARKLLAALTERSSQTYVQPVGIALLHAALGEKDRAFEWLEKAYADRSVSLVYLKVDPAFAPLRSDAHFQDLLKRLGLQ
jgi:serine/threonine-protein kinase